MRGFCRNGVAFAAACLAASSAAADEPALTPLNPVAGFELSLSGWTLASSVGGLAEWTPDDADGNPLSGAARITGPAGQYALRACFPSPVELSTGFYYVATSSVRTSGATARVLTTVTLGFAGDAPGDAGDCPGPVTHDATLFNDLVDPAPAFLKRRSTARHAAGPLAAVTVLVDKPGAADVVVDDVQVFATDHVFVDDF